MLITNAKDCLCFVCFVVVFFFGLLGFVLFSTCLFIQFGICEMSNDECGIQMCMYLCFVCVFVTCDAKIFLMFALLFG